MIMSKKTPALFPSEGLNDAYKVVLKKTMEEAHELQEKTGPALHQLIDKTSQALSDVGELTKEEAEKIAKFLKRDLVEAASYMTEHGEDLKKWLALDVELIEGYFLSLLEKAADQTKVELMKLKSTAENAEYHTGEITGPGVLMCDKCGENLHFHDAGHIPPCPKCHDTRFHRLHCQ